MRIIGPNIFGMFSALREARRQLRPGRHQRRPRRHHHPERRPGSRDDRQDRRREHGHLRDGVGRQQGRHRRGRPARVPHAPRPHEGHPDVHRGRRRRRQTGRRAEGGDAAQARGRHQVRALQARRRGRGLSHRLARGLGRGLRRHHAAVRCPARRERPGGVQPLQVPLDVEPPPRRERRHRDQRRRHRSAGHRRLREVQRQPLRRQRDPARHLRLGDARLRLDEEPDRPHRRSDLARLHRRPRRGPRARRDRRGHLALLRDRRLRRGQPGDDDQRNLRRSTRPPESPIVFSIFGGATTEAALDTLTKKGVPVFGDVYETVACLGGLYRHWRNASAEPAGDDEEEIDEAAIASDRRGCPCRRQELPAGRRGPRPDGGGRHSDAGDAGREEHGRGGPVRGRASATPSS